MYSAASSPSTLPVRYCGAFSTVVAGGGTTAPTEAPDQMTCFSTGPIEGGSTGATTSAPTFASRNARTCSTIFAGSLLLGRALAPVEAIIGAWRPTLAAKEALTRIRTLTADQADRPAPVRLPAPRGDVALDNVSWTPPGALRHDARGFSVRIQAGRLLTTGRPRTAGEQRAALERELQRTRRAAGVEGWRWDGLNKGGGHEPALAVEKRHAPTQAELAAGRRAGWERFRLERVQIGETRVPTAGHAQEQRRRH